MEVKELMFGDWVQEPNGDYCQVEGFPYFDCVRLSHEFIVHDMVIKPIPLTEEIVKLNGFKKCSWDVMRWKCDAGFSIDKADGIFKAYICGKLKPITYVHELQHLLRLCGLIELADNFKIE